MGYVSLTNNSPDARVHIRGASNRTVGQMIDVTKPLTGTFDILLSDNSTHYFINITSLINEATLTNSELNNLIKEIRIRVPRLITQHPPFKMPII